MESKTITELIREQTPNQSNYYIDEILEVIERYDDTLALSKEYQGKLAINNFDSKADELYTLAEYFDYKRCTYELAFKLENDPKLKARYDRKSRNADNTHSWLMELYESACVE